MTIKTYSEQDITYVLTVRLSEYTPWIYERIRFCLNFYQPVPQILVLDFGSEEYYSSLIKDLCTSSHTRYIKIHDYETFSAAKAKNHAFQYIETDLMLLSDIDCVFDQNIFAKLAKDASLLEFEKNPRRYITFPVTHLAQDISENFERLEMTEQEKYLKQFDYYSNQAAFRQDIEFIAPYSNILFMHKKLYDLSGGYCDVFRGHGSEDFEYLIRLGYLTSNIPKPKNLQKDFYGPLKDSFWQANSYEGFRKYLEALTFTSETLGYKTYHLWHPKPSDQGYWTQNNDWKRERFNNILGIYLNQEEKILELDYHVRKKTALCLMNDPDQWGYFLPIRMMGYHLTVASRNHQAEINQAYKKILNKEIDLVCIFNPYMKSHKHYYELIQLAKDKSIEIQIIERGALPNTLYYAEEVAYNDPDYYDELHIQRNVFNKTLTNQQLQHVKKSIQTLRKGQHTLENMQDYATTIEYLAKTLIHTTTNIFIPLQLPDDMAVTYFTGSHQNYDDFMKSIQRAAMKFPHLQFYLKPHPLMPNTQGLDHYKNITLLPDLNIHALLDTFDHIILYNSGVGLLSALHQKKPYNIGNAFYSLNGRFSTEVSNIENAIHMIETGTENTIDLSLLYLFMSWLMQEKYSTFQAQDKIKDFGNRLSHGYKNIQLQSVNILGNHLEIGGQAIFQYSEKSYLSSKLKCHIDAQPAIASLKPNSQKTEHNTLKPLPASFKKRKIRKLLRDPKQFLFDAIRNRLDISLST